jgi:peroxiredoxin
VRLTSVRHCVILIVVNVNIRRYKVKIQVGMEAPNFELMSHLDDKIRLSEYRGRHNVLIAFFPLAWTPV